MKIGSPETQSWSEAEEHSGKKRKQQCEKKCVGIDTDFGEARNTLRAENANPLNCPGGKKDSERASAERQRNTFGKKLADDAGASGAERGANGDFFLSSNSARKLKIGDVGAGDEQNKSDRGEKNNERTPHVTNDLLEKR